MRFKVGQKVFVKNLQVPGVVYDYLTEKDSIEFLVFMKELDESEYFVEEELEELQSIENSTIRESEDIRSYNVGNSNYSKYSIQPWDIWLEYNLNPWDADLVKRILRTKTEIGMSAVDARILDYEKMIHICKERIRQLKRNKS